MRELNTRLREVIQARYGSVRSASKALGLNANTLQQIVDNENSEPELKTLWSMAETFDWPLLSVICWTLGREAPVATDPERQLAECLTAIGVDEGLRESIVELVLATRARAPSPNVH